MVFFVSLRRVASRSRASRIWNLLSCRQKKMLLKILAREGALLLQVVEDNVLAFAGHAWLLFPYHFSKFSYHFWNESSRCDAESHPLRTGARPLLESPYVKNSPDFDIRKFFRGSYVKNQPKIDVWIGARGICCFSLRPRKVNRHRLFVSFLKRKTAPLSTEKSASCSILWSRLFRADGDFRLMPREGDHLLWIMFRPFSWK